MKIKYGTIALSIAGNIIKGICRRKNMNSIRIIFHFADELKVIQLVLDPLQFVDRLSRVWLARSASDQPHRLNGKPFSLMPPVGNSLEN